MFRRLKFLSFIAVVLVGTNIHLSVAQSADEALQLCTPGTKIEFSALEPAPIDRGDSGLFVVTTVSPITNLAFNVGGNRIKIHGLVPEGVNSHTFEPKPSDAATLAQADIVFVNGLNLELPTIKLAEANLKPGAEIVELGPKAIREGDWKFDFSFPQEEGNPNPHLWINPPAGAALRGWDPRSFIRA